MEGGGRLSVNHTCLSSHTGPKCRCLLLPTPSSFLGSCRLVRAYHTTALWALWALGSLGSCRLVRAYHTAALWALCPCWRPGRCGSSCDSPTSSRHRRKEPCLLCCVFRRPWRGSYAAACPRLLPCAHLGWAKAPLCCCQQPGPVLPLSGKGDIYICPLRPLVTNHRRACATDMKPGSSNSPAAPGGNLGRTVTAGVAFPGPRPWEQMQPVFGF